MAEECSRLAETSDDTGVKIRYGKVAAQWTELAEGPAARSDRSNDVARKEEVVKGRRKSSKASTALPDAGKPTIS